MRVTQLDPYIESSALGLDHDFFYVDDENSIFRLDLNTMTKTRLGCVRHIYQLVPFAGCLLVITDPPYISYEPATFMLALDPPGKILWESDRNRWKKTRSSLFHLEHDDDFNSYLVQFDLCTGQELRRYQGFDVYVCNCGIVVNDEIEDFYWLDEHGDPKHMPFQYSWAESTHLLEDGSQVRVSTNVLEWTRNDEILKTWTLPPSLAIMNMYLMANGELMVCHRQAVLVNPPRHAGLHYRYYGATRGNYTSETTVRHGCLIYDHRTYRPEWLLLGLNRVLPKDLLELVVDYGVCV